jgi:hypothetical protein
MSVFIMAGGDVNEVINPFCHSDVYIIRLSHSFFLGRL